MTDEEKKAFEELTKSFSDMKTQNEQLLKKVEGFESQLAGQKKSNEATESRTFFEKLQTEGKLPPARFEKAIEADKNFSTEEDRKIFRDYLSSSEKIVNPNGNHAAQDTNNNDSIGGSITAKIRAFATEKNINYEAAAKALYDQNPKAFEQEDIK